MEEKARKKAVLSLLKATFILLISIILIFLRVADVENLVTLIIGRILLGLLGLDVVLYVVILARSRTGKTKLAPIFLALGMVVGFAIPVIMITISYEDENVALPLLLSFIGIIAGITFTVLLFKEGDKLSSESPVLYDEAYALQFMKSKVTKEMPLSELVDVFEAMCQLPLQNENDIMLLYETGAENEEEYLIHLVRQANAPDEEHYQITMDATFPLDEVAGKKESTEWSHVWNYEINDNFFNYIRNSIQYRLLKDKKPVMVEMSVNRT